MTRRFDRPGRQVGCTCSPSPLPTSDFNLAGAYSYEQALLAIRRLGLSMAAVEQQFRWMAFDVIARNQDDHVKNIAFLMDPTGSGRSPPRSTSLSPTRRGAGGRADTRCRSTRDSTALPDDLRACAEVVSMQRRRAEEISRRYWPP